MALKTLGHIPGSVNETQWHSQLVKAFSDVSGKRCRVCGLGGVGHAPDTIRAGYAPHAFDGVAVACGHSYAGRQCSAGNCAHIMGHCEACN
jgi:hypothetical protein